MGAASIEPGRRRMIAIRSASGDGEAAAIEFGDPGQGSTSPSPAANA